MCNIRCTSREKWENGSPQKPQSCAKARGDRHTHTYTHVQHMTHAHRVTKRTEKQSSWRSHDVQLSSSSTKKLIVWRLPWSERKKKKEMASFCVDEALIWCRLRVLLQFADNNHNEATPANLHSAELLFNQKAAYLRHTLLVFLGCFFWSSKLQKKHRTFPLWSRIVYKLYWVFRSWHIGSVCIRWGTWFIAAMIGPVWWVISLAQYLSPHFPQLGKGHQVPCRLFYTGVRFLERSALGSQLPLWLRKRPRFIRVGMVFIRLAYCAAWMEVRACVWEMRHASSQL